MYDSACDRAPATEPALDHGPDGDEASSLVTDAVAVLAALPLRERVEALRLGAQEVFAVVSVPVVDWGDDADADLMREAVTVDEELAALQAERAALVEVTAGVVSVGRSLGASVRMLADQHARVVSRFDTLDADQLERRLSSPATALVGEFAGEDYAPILGISPTAAARWTTPGVGFGAHAHEHCRFPAACAPYPWATSTMSPHTPKAAPRARPTCNSYAVTLTARRLTDPGPSP